MNDFPETLYEMHATGDHYTLVILQQTQHDKNVKLLDGNDTLTIQLSAFVFGIFILGK
jgi:hypothetical protein